MACNRDIFTFTYFMRYTVYVALIYVLRVFSEKFNKVLFQLTDSMNRYKLTLCFKVCNVVWKIKYSVRRETSHQFVQCVL
jgi:hypothetical protein